MCGICGVTYFDREKQVSERLVKRMCDVIRHRGPDDEGIMTIGAHGMGMRRLSIIDLVSGKQPIANEDNSMWIVFNGEIYNYKSLREDLVKKGHRFKTNTDTEAILHAYEEYGEECPEKLNGMFGFAIYNQNDQTLFLARDRLGIKPLYYFHDASKFAFGSELKSILQVPEIPREVDHRSLDVFLTFEYIPSPLSIFKGISKVPPGHSLTLKSGKISIKKYWQLEINEQNATEDELCEQLVELLQDAVKIRLMSDVPLGAFLSGGIDSSSIVALMSRVMDRPVKTFSIGFKEASYNESEYARSVAEFYGTEHHEFILEANALELTEKLFGILDEPFGDFSIFPTYLVSKMARQHVTVSLSGDGGDELFAGYDTYIANRMANAYARVPKFLHRGIVAPILNMIPPTEKKKGLINRAKRFSEGLRLPDDLAHTRWMIFLQAAEKERLYSADMLSSLNEFDSYGFIRNYFKEAKTQDALNQQSYVDIKSYLVDDILVKVDRMSMATSLEARVPFLDHRVVEFSATVPSHLKLQGKTTKYLLKKAMADYLPPDILTRGKEGFSIPIKNWIKHDLKDLMMDVLSPGRIKREGFFESTFVEQLKNEHLSGKENHSHRLWAMMVFGIWQDYFLRNGETLNETDIQTSKEFASI